MVRKPDIQYVGQFYVHGSEAQQLAPEQEKKQPKTRLPLVHIEKIQQISLDPVAIAGLLVAVFMLVTLVIGTLSVQNAWQDYRAMESYVSNLRRENAQLESSYRASYNMDEIIATANTMGLIPRSEAQTISITVTVPEPEQEPTIWEDFIWFIKGLFA
ncbi:MAG: hypothetical protein IJ001_05550 [Oscillospiraceae bacterium]|nr:hypothetical protein [Oscillospiraceae bacterium]